MAEQDDPFAEFGGKVVAQEPDPFAEFGGSVLKKKVQPKDSKSGGQPLSAGSNPFPLSQTPIIPTILTDKGQKDYSKYVKPKTKPKTFKEAIDDDDSYVGALWNQIPGSLKDLVGGATKLVGKGIIESPIMQQLKLGFDIGKYATGATDPNPIKQIASSENIERVGRYGEELVDKLRTSSSSIANEENIQKGFDVTDGIGMKDAKALPVMLTRMLGDAGLAIPTGGISFVAQGYNQGLKEYDSAVKDNPDLKDDNVRELFATGYGMVNGLADKLGLDFITKNPAASKATKKFILNKGLQELARVEGKVTSDIIEKTFQKAAKDTFNKVKTVGLKAALGAGVEGGTEAIQGGISDGLRILTNKLSNQDIFNSQDLKEDFWKNRINDLAGGVSMGGVLGTGMHGLRSSNKYIAERVAESTTPEQLEELKLDLVKQVEEGTLEPEKAEVLNNSIDKYSEANQRLPQGLTTTQRAKALQLIAERDLIKQQKERIVTETENVDDAIKPQAESDALILENKKQQNNDEIREITAEAKYKYFKDPEKDKWYKQLGEAKPEEITEDYYQLQKQDKGIPKELKEDKENATEIRNIEENNQQQYTRADEQQQGGQEDRINEEELITESQAETGGGDSIVESREIQEEVIQPETNEQITEETQASEDNGLEPIGASVEGESTTETDPPEVDYSDIIAPSVNLTKDQLSQSREQMGLPEIEVDATRSDELVDNQASEFISNGGDIFKIVDDLISGKKVTVTDTEVAILTKTLAEKNAQLDKVKGKLMNAVRDEDQRAIDLLLTEKDQLIKEVSDIQTAGRKASRNQGRGLRQFQISKVQDNSLSGFIDMALRNNGNKALSKEQIKEAETAYNEYERLWTESQAKLAETEAEYEKLKEEYAQLKFKKQSDTVRRRQRSNIPREERIKEIRLERKIILNELSNIARKQRSNLSSTPINVEYIKPLAKLARNYIEEGIVNLDELVSKIHGDVKEYIEGVTERQIRDAISGYDRNSPVTKDGIQLQIEELKTQARLISAIEDAERKVGKSFGTKRKESSERVKELKQQLFDLTGNERGVAALKVRVKNQIADLTRRLSKKDYVMPNKKTLILDEEAKQLRDKALKVKREFQISTEKNRLANRSKAEKNISAINNVIGLIKSLKATLDLSAPGRQGLIAAVNHPILAAKAFVGMHKAAFSQEYYDRWNNDLISSPAYQVMLDSGLALTAEKTANVLAKEEDFASNLAEKIPGLKFPVKGSERAYSYFLNSLRANIFMDAATELARDGYTLEDNKNEYESIARVINNETGRGGLGRLERHADLAGLAIWSPRLMASRINTFTSIFDPSYTPRARKKAALDLLRFIGVASAVMLMASANEDWDIEWNPLSSNFGKVKRGNVRYSLMGGMESYITFMARILLGRTKTGGEIKRFYDDKYKGDNAWDYIGTFFRGKTAPDIGILINLLARKDVVKNKYEWWDVPDEVLPLVIPELMDAYAEGGIAEVIKTLPFITYGIGVNRYSEQRGKRKKDPVGVFESLYKTAVRNLTE